MKFKKINDLLVVFSFIVMAASLITCSGPFTPKEEGKGSFTIVFGDSTKTNNSRAVYPDADIANLKFIVKFTPLEGGEAQTFSATGNSEFKGNIDIGQYKVTMDIFTLPDNNIYARGVAEFNPVEIETGENFIRVFAFDANNTWPPVVSEQPQGADYHAGADAEEIKVTVDQPGDGGMLMYQWYSNDTDSNYGGTLIPGATSASYMPSTETDGPTYYYVIITNDKGGRQDSTSIPSKAVRVYVNKNAARPVISEQPAADTTIQRGKTVTLRVFASVTDKGTITYQWYSNTADSISGGTPIVGANLSDYTTPETLGIGIYYYYCVVTNTIPDNGDGGDKTATETSSLAMVTVNNLVNALQPVISGQPAAATTIIASETLSLSVTVSDMEDGGTLTYQWYNNGTTNSNIGGTPIEDANLSTYTAPPNTLEAGTYHYYCVVTNTIPYTEGVVGKNTATDTSKVAVVTVYGIGFGTIDDPFIVYNLTTLKEVGKGKDLGTGNWSLSAYYKQIRDIDIIGQDWTPIGSSSAPFTGCYDGDGHKISNLTINKSASTSYYGLFGMIQGNKNQDDTIWVQNLGIVACRIESGEYVGGIAGRINDVNVKNCYVTGTVKGTNYVGGVVGYIGDIGGKVQNSYFTGTVSGTQYVGGIVGRIRRTDPQYGLVQYCYVTGDVSGTSGNVGGVAGYINGSRIQRSYTTGNVSGTQYVGGVAGYIDDSDILNSYATGNVSGTAAYAVGGVAGYMIRSAVKYCYTTGNISAGTSNNTTVCGVVGTPSGNVNNCVALNPNITSSAGSRVTSSTSSYISNNYGRSDMKKGGVEFSWSPTGQASQNGENITEADWNSGINFWSYRAYFNDGETPLWDIEEGKLPTLRDMPGREQDPAVQTY